MNTLTVPLGLLKKIINKLNRALKRMYFKYHFKNIVLLISPFKVSYNSKLNALKDKDKYLKEYKPYLSEFMSNKQHNLSATGGLVSREWDHYGDYIRHQKEKFNRLTFLHGGFSSLTILRWRRKYILRFKELPSKITKNSVIVCLGARQGTEVEVLRDLGFNNAIGIDLNPGPENPLVKFGDFMNMDYEDNSVDFVYTNCIDHVFDLDLFFQEQVRILKTTGKAMFEFAGPNNFGLFENIQWNSMGVPVTTMLKYFNEIDYAGCDRGFPHRGGMWMYFLVSNKA